jgi:DNA-directed RNA polymerase specialized sigma24 family protein
MLLTSPETPINDLGVKDPAESPGPLGVEDLEEAAVVFTSLRPRLFGIAYRMLSGATEAEDLVQEVWLRGRSMTAARVANPAAILATTMTRLAINALQSARVRPETYVGQWLPNRSTRARTRTWAPNAGRPWSSRPCC